MTKILKRVIVPCARNSRCAWWYKYEQYLKGLVCGFRKAHPTQHAFFGLLRTWQNYLDKSGIVGTKRIDLTKVYDCLPDDLIAKFEVYGIDKSCLNFLLSYLSNRKQLTKINSSYSDWYDIIRGGGTTGIYFGHSCSIYLLMTPFF